MTNRPSQLMAICMLAIGVAGCQDDLDDLTPPARMALSPTMAVVAPGTTQRVSATFFGKTGGELQYVVDKWIMSDTTVATISSDGVITGRRHGFAVIRAEAAGVAAVSYVTVKAFE